MTLTKRGDVYHASFRTADGKRKLITTRCTDKEEAKKVVKESGLKDLEMAAKAGRLTREAIGQITTGRRLTMEQAVDKYIDGLGRRRSARTAANSAITLQAWMKAAGVEKLHPSAVTEEHVDQWINNPDSTTKAGTRRVNLSIIRTFFDWCIDHGWVMGNPAGKQRVHVNMSQLSHEQKEPEERECFTDFEIKRILAAWDKKGDIFWRVATRISNEIGLRLGDICQLEWACFETPGRAVVWTDKRDRRVSVPISHELTDLLAEVPMGHMQYLFPEQRQLILTPTKRSNLSNQFKRLCESLGIHKTFHSLRHTCITRWAKQGKSLESIGKDVGHVGTETTKGYVH